MLSGYSASIIAYGQSGSGKTHTMFGSFNDPEKYGLVPRVLDDLFRKIELSGRVEKTVYDVRISVIEIYMEMVQDLLMRKLL